MFGYVLPAKQEMKVRDFEMYRSYYCGVCKQLGKSYGVFSRFLLNYDLVLVGLLTDALSGESGQMHCEGCFANPVMKRHTLHQSNGLVIASDALVLLSWHKSRDTLHDEAFHKRFAYILATPFLFSMYKKAKEKHPELNAILEEQMQNQLTLEKDSCCNIDMICEPTAKMCEAVFAMASDDPAQKRILGRLGLFAGQIVYLLDAAEDFDDDAKNGSYNVFVLNEYTKEEMITAVQRRTRMAAGEIALCYNLLNFTQYKDILDNIFFLGLPQGIAAAGIKRTKRSNGHGQIESV